jgi:hypothetical protein
MNDPAAEIFRYLMLAFVPAMLLFPLVFVLFVPAKVEDAEAQEIASRRMVALTVFTFLAVALWGALTLIASQTRIPAFDQIARMAWVLFFPLWFGLAMPTAIARNPTFGGGLSGGCAIEPKTRTASLVPRTRENPIRTWHWLLMGLITAGTFAAMAARGAFPFGPDGPAADSARFRWALLTAIYAVTTLMTVLIVPYSISRSQMEAEPLDPKGSEELRTMYRDDRRARSQIIFWLIGVIQPLTIGWLFAVVVWNRFVSGQTMGLIGAIIGTGFGMTGAIFGIASAFRRIRIAKARTRLESATNFR